MVTPGRDRARAADTKAGMVPDLAVATSISVTTLPHRADVAGATTE